MFCCSEQLQVLTAQTIDMLNISPCAGLVLMCLLVGNLLDVSHVFSKCAARMCMYVSFVYLFTHIYFIILMVYLHLLVSAYILHVYPYKMPPICKSIKFCHLTITLFLINGSYHGYNLS